MTLKKSQSSGPEADTLILGLVEPPRSPRIIQERNLKSSLALAVSYPRRGWTAPAQGQPEVPPWVLNSTRMRTLKGCYNMI